MQSLEEKIAELTKEHNKSLEEKIAKLTEEHEQQAKEESMIQTFSKYFENVKVDIHFSTKEIVIGDCFCISYRNVPKISDILKLVSNFEIVDYYKIEHDSSTTMTPKDGNYWQYSEKPNAKVENVGQFILRSEYNSVFLHFGIIFNKTVYNVKCLLGHPFRFHSKRNDFLGGYEIYGEEISYPEIKIPYLNPEIDKLDFKYRFSGFKYSSGSSQYPKSCVLYPSAYEISYWNCEERKYCILNVDKINLFQFLANFNKI